MCLRCYVKECASDFPGTFVGLIEAEDMDKWPRSMWLAVIRWFEEIERGSRPECLACDHVFTLADRPVSLLCIAPPTARHLFITGVCSECFPVVDVEQLAAHVNSVIGLPRAIRQSYN
jgi:hypothetical protein